MNNEADGDSSHEKELPEKVDHFVRQLRHLAFCLDTFVMGSEMAKEYQSSLDELSAAGKSAFTKAILVDYASVFMSHEFGEGLSGPIATKYLTKSSEFDKGLHSALLELRHNLVAHASFESPGFVANVARFHNTASDTHAHKNVSVPIQYFLQNSSMGYINDTDTIGHIVHHLDACRSLTQSKANQLVGTLSNIFLEHAPIIDTWDFVDVLNDSNIGAIAKNETDDLSIETKGLEDLQIGRENVQFLVTRLRMDRPFTGDYLGDGYRIRSEPTSPEITVSFLHKNTSVKRKGWMGS